MMVPSVCPSLGMAKVDDALRVFRWGVSSPAGKVFFGYFLLTLAFLRFLSMLVRSVLVAAALFSM